MAIYKELTGGMNIPVIGSEGSLGRALCPVLKGRYQVRRADVNCPNEPNALRADIRCQEDMERAVDGADVVVGLAAYHGGYSPPPTDETRFDVNVVGAFRLFQACPEARVPGMRAFCRYARWQASSILGVAAGTGVFFLAASFSRNHP